MMKRGRAQSAYFGQLDQQKAENVESASNIPQSPEDSFKQVIEKMSLTDASKEGYQDGAALIGRDKERREITKFLRGGITGRLEDKASLFIGGPPGVGKTACVRSVINELKKEQSKGKVDQFEFITLNGMEMRHPFEAYIKLWEMVSEDRAKCSADAASRKLRTYFTEGGSGDKSKVYVVLLDELDYLVTKKQNVLYDFFDWRK
jgi:origin recognition complex subunit 1